MSAKEWGLTFLAQILASPILLAISLIIAAVLFIVAYVTLVVFGLVSALIYGLFGLGILWLIGTASRDTLGKHWWFILIVPAFFIFGWLSDHVAGLALMSLVPTITQGFVLAQNDVATGNSIPIYGPYAVGIVSLIVAVIALLLTIRIKNKYWWVR